MGPAKRKVSRRRFPKGKKVRAEQLPSDDMDETARLIHEMQDPYWSWKFMRRNS